MFLLSMLYPECAQTFVRCWITRGPHESVIFVCGQERGSKETIRAPSDEVLMSTREPR